MKKVLSFVLILALVLGSFSFAFGLSDVTEATANSEAITVVDDLGIVEGFPDGSFKPAQNVTRAEFAAMITRALGVPESALAGFSATSFKDTTGYGWAVKYLAFCESKGIMIGDGMGNVMPGRTINVNEAMTMVLRAVGYTENSALLVGTWPSKYVTIAQNVGLYDDVAAMLTVDRANAAQIIFNALTVQKVQVDADGATTGLTTGLSPNEVIVNMLTSGLGATVEDPKVIVGNEDSKINLQKYKGAYAITYTKDDNIIAVGEIKSTFLTGSFDGGTFTANDVDYTGLTSTNAVNTTVGGVVFANGVDENNVTLSGAAAYSDGDAVTLSVKLNGKKITDFYAALIWDTGYSGVAGLFEAGDLDDSTLMAQDFTLDDDDNIDYTTFRLVGVDSLEDIAVDNVVSVYTNSSNDEITKIEVGTEKVTGTVERLKANGDIVIDGNTYSKAYNAMSFPASVGDEGTLYLDVNGDGFSWDVTDASSDNYAMVTGNSQDVGRDRTVVLFDKAGMEKEYVIKSDATGTTLGAVTDNLALFALNSDGKVKDLKVLTKSTATLNLGMSASRALFAGKVVDNGVVVFVKNGSGDYDLGAVGDIETGVDLTGKAEYYTDTTTGKVEVIIIDSAFAGGSDMSYGVMNSVEAAAVDGDEVDYIVGFADGKALVAYTDDDYLPTGKVSSNTGLVAFKVNSDGVITAVSTGGAVTSIAATNGALMARTDNSVQLISTGAAFVAIDPNAVVYVYDGTKDAGKQYSVGSIASLKVVSGATVYLYQMDSDSEQYDYVIYVK